MDWAYRNMLVEDSQVMLARTITDTLAPVGGQDMYTTPLSPTGLEPATYWISSGLIDPDYAALMPLLEWTQDDDGVWQKTVISPGYPDVITDMCVQAGLEVTLSEVQTLLDATDVTMEEPQQSWVRMGLQIVQPPIEDENV